MSTDQDVGQYISGLIGQPWVQDGANCGYLVRKVQKDLFGIELPAVLEEVKIGQAIQARRAIEECAERVHWKPTDRLVHGAIALMHRSYATCKSYTHMGVYLAVDEGGVLHTDTPHGVVFERLVVLTARRWKVDYWVRVVHAR